MAALSSTISRPLSIPATVLVGSVVAAAAG